MAEITLLDGSIGQEVVKRSGDRATPLWSTAVMVDRPGVVGAIHADYFAAGATIATTNTYAVLRDRLQRAGLEDHFTELLNKAAAQAATARDTHGSGRVAAALGPLIASYRPDICPPPDEAKPVYAELVKLLEPSADLFLIETVASLEHAKGALLGCAGTDKPVWLAASVSDEDGTLLRSGEPLAALAPLVEEFQPDAVLLNCSRPEVIGEGLEIVKAFGKPYGAYANGFTRISESFLKDAPTVDALEQRQDLGPVAYAEFAMGWVAQGATITGGCCEVGPEHIAELARQLRAAGHRIV
ncbi:homocysteine S-methyltransferase family protein [Leisingera sp. HS039]|uniref:homocysteine S-methyltransferase family protein n=1 Tax=unclassified Leisingera TaxID=2614906 RepID=UPI00107087A1|nr:MULTISPECIES: homocysteine S-methyltransferase family protein [unclassified Leisingera]MBQ4823947.1 homocysteine S-methyltransferase family protein [Leisingera sp. HS039]QBR38519.1 homocysteine S-methyltransferase family protein [Leisingera sp. NJS201]